MKRITIFYLCALAERPSGAGSYTAHLCRSYELQGYTVDLCHIAARTSEPKEFTPGTMYRNLSMQDALKIIGTQPTIVAYAHFRLFPEQTLQLLQAGVSAFVLHATAELHGPLLDALIRLQTPVIAIRTAVQRLMANRGVRSLFIPHPYVRAQPVKRPFISDYRAVSVCRVDFAKHTDVVIQANQLVRHSQRVHIFSTVNRMYAHHVLDKRWPEWRADYRGPFALGGVMDVLARTELVVDLTYWKGDGAGGSQYAFMEAWDARVPLIVHARWCGDNTGEVQAGVTCMVVETPTHLAQLLNSQFETDEMVNEAERRLLDHDPATVVQQYLAAIG